MELVQITRQLMPAGKPAFMDVIKYPMIRDLVKQDERNMLKVMYLMVKDFCSSLNVVRNMNEDQMIEAAAMLLDECGNFRIEDYVMMFAMAKKGELVRIMDRVDIQMITTMMDEYWSRRNYAAEYADKTEIEHLESLGTPIRQLEQMHPADAKMVQAIEGLAAGLNCLREFKAPIDEETARKQIIANPNYKNPYEKDGAQK